MPAAPRRHASSSRHSAVTPALLAGLRASDTALAHVDLERCVLSAADASRLADALSGNGAVRALALRGTNVDDAHAATLAPALASLRALERLEVSFSPALGARGVRALAGALLGRANARLHTLVLAGCSALDADALAALAAPLPVDGALRTLSLAGNDLRRHGGGVHALADALALNTCVERVVLDRCVLPEEATSALLDVAERHRTLREVRVDQATGLSPSVRQRAKRLSLTSMSSSSSSSSASSSPQPSSSSPQPSSSSPQPSSSTSQQSSSPSSTPSSREMFGRATWAEAVAVALDGLASADAQRASSQAADGTGSAPPLSPLTDAQQAAVERAAAALRSVAPSRFAHPAIAKHLGASVALALSEATTTTTADAAADNDHHDDAVRQLMRGVHDALARRTWIEALRRLGPLRRTADEALRADVPAVSSAALTRRDAQRLSALCDVARAQCALVLPSTTSAVERAVDSLDTLRSGALALPSADVPGEWRALRWQAASMCARIAQGDASVALEAHAPAAYTLACAALAPAALRRDARLVAPLLRGGRTLASVLRSMPGTDAPAPAVVYVSSRAPATLSAAASATASSSGDVGDGLAGAAADWARLKAERRHGAPSCKALDLLMELTGLERVKQAMLDMYRRVQLERELGFSSTQQRLHVCMRGNPGTGKTTVSRLYAQLLSEIGALEGSQFVETTGQRLASLGTQELQRHLDAIDDAKGGVLFVDEAYQLDPASDRSGRQVLDMLLDVTETRRDRLVVVLAGYERDMEKLLASNPGLSSRFPTQFPFDDYSDGELVAIFERTMRRRKGTEELRLADDAAQRAMRVAMQRVGRRRGTMTFGNARDVENAFDRVMTRHLQRVMRDRVAGSARYALTRDDLLGPPPDEAVRNSAALRQLDAMVGLRRVKRAVHEMVAQVRQNVEREEREEPILPITLHRCFLGNPGTGKTSVAKLYARILTELGLLSKGDVVVVTPKDLIGDAVGVSQTRTRETFDRAAGGVLVIDEAYGLYETSSSGADSGASKANTYGREVIDTLVELIPGDGQPDFAVLLLGYENDLVRHGAAMVVGDGDEECAVCWCARW